MSFETGSTSYDSPTEHLSKSKSVDVLENMTQQLRDKVGHRIHMLRLQVQTSDRKSQLSTEMPIICDRRYQLPVCTSTTALPRNIYQSVMLTSIPSGRFRSSLSVVNPSSSMTSPHATVTSYKNGHLTRSTSYNGLAALAPKRSNFEPCPCSPSPAEHEIMAKTWLPSSAVGTECIGLHEVERTDEDCVVETDVSGTLDLDSSSVGYPSSSGCAEELTPTSEHSPTERGDKSPELSACLSQTQEECFDYPTLTTVCLPVGTTLSSPADTPVSGSVDTLLWSSDIDCIRQVANTHSSSATMLSSTRLVAKYANAVKIFNVDCRNGRHDSAGIICDDVISQSTRETQSSDNTEILKITLEKGVLGLGFCIDGGKDAPMGSAPISVKRLFKGDTAAKYRLKAGDEILDVNEYPFDDVTHFDAWKVLKNLPNGLVRITIRRKLDEISPHNT